MSYRRKTKIEIFNANVATQNWIKPPGATWVLIAIVSPGAGGNLGATVAAGGTVTGSAGGFGGAFGQIFLPAAMLPAVVVCFVQAGSPGGTLPGVVPVSNQCNFGDFFFVGGNGGVRVTGLYSLQAGTGVGGSNGGIPNTGAANVARAALGGAGGGRGGGINVGAAVVAVDGGVVGAFGSTSTAGITGYYGSIAGGVHGNTNLPGQPGASLGAGAIIGGGGGGGGGSNVTAAGVGGVGGDGGFPGGGGGAGGSGITAVSTPGVGGKGGDGIMIVTTFF